MKPNNSKTNNPPQPKKKANRENSFTVADGPKDEVILDAKNPVPLDTGNTGITFLKGDRYIKFLPPYNNYVQMLLEAKMLSVTHGACVNTKAEYCAGIGFQDKDGQKVDQRILDWFKSMNLKNEPVMQINETAFNSRFTFGNAPIELVRFTSRKGQRVLMMYVHDLQEWRLGEPDNDDIIRFAIGSKMFRTRNGSMSFGKDNYNAAKKLRLYSPYNTDKQNWTKFADGTERTMIWYKENTLGYPYYGLPSAVQAMIYQLLEYKGARYDLDNFDNNLVMGGVIALRGNLSQPEANRLGLEIINSHTGDGKRGRWAVLASEQGIDASDVHPFETAKDGSYIQSKESWRQDIILANKWDAVLAGLVNASTLGKGAGFLTKLIEWKERTVIRPAQNHLMQWVWNTVFDIAQEWMGLPFSDYNLEIKNNIDISGLTDVDITPAVTVGEVRQAKGLPLFGDERDKQLMTAPAKGTNSGTDNTNNNA